MTDIVIIGCGVAGLSAAIAAADRGLRALVLERGDGPPERPGETLHPGMEALFSQLGVREEAEHAATSRHAGIRVRHGRHVQSQRFGGPASEPWRGYHIPRERLHDILLRRARGLNVAIKFGCAARSVQRLSSARLSVETTGGKIACGWLFDGTGPANWLKRFDRTGYRAASPQLSVCYGYDDHDQTGTTTPWPCLTLMPWGWSWDAALGDGTLAWVRLFNSRDARRQFAPRYGKSADATWLVAEIPAHENMFRIGDSALRMDPSSGKGVLRAMMSAIMAVHLVKSTNDGRIDRRATAMAYSRWITDWFDSDVRELGGLLNRCNTSE